MKKAALQLIVALLLFAAIWFGLSQIQFVDESTEQKLQDKTESRIGGLMLTQLDLKFRKSQNDSLAAAVERIHRRLCEANDIDPDSITVHLYQTDIKNAMALPGQNVVIFTGIFGQTDSAEEFAGILAHEIAHIEKDHIRERLIREFGISLLTTISGLEGAPEVAANVFRMISTSAYSRNHEREADRTAADYLVQAEINPIHLANVLLRLAGLQENSDHSIPVWISTHPDPRERASLLLEEFGEEMETSQPLYDGNWQELAH